MNEYEYKGNIRQLSDFEIHMLSILSFSEECIWSFLNDLQKSDKFINETNYNSNAIIDFFEYLYKEDLIELFQNNMKVNFNEIRNERKMDFDTPYWFVLSQKGKHVFKKFI